MGAGSVPKLRLCNAFGPTVGTAAAACCSDWPATREFSQGDNDGNVGCTVVHPFDARVNEDALVEKARNILTEPAAR